MLTVLCKSTLLGMSLAMVYVLCYEALLLSIQQPNYLCIYNLILIYLF